MRKREKARNAGSERSQALKGPATLSFPPLSSFVYYTILRPAVSLNGFDSQTRHPPDILEGEDEDRGISGGAPDVEGFSQGLRGSPDVEGFSQGLRGSPDVEGFSHGLRGALPVGFTTVLAVA